ncbi:hypothetical protein Tco_0438990 [Tanacetum coccineum]
MMADNRTMAQLPSKAPTEGYEDAIVVPEITADNFELKHGLLTLASKPNNFIGHDNEDPRAHIRFIPLQQDNFFNDEVHQRTEYVDSLNSAAGGNFLDKMPRDCLRIIESKSKVHNSSNKLVVSKVSSSSSTLGISKCLDLADLGASINLTPLSVLEQIFISADAQLLPCAFDLLNLWTRYVYPLPDR